MTFCCVLGCFLYGVVVVVVVVTRAAVCGASLLMAKKMMVDGCRTSVSP